MPAGQRRIRRTLVNYAFALACVATFAIGYVLVSADQALTPREILANLGLNLVASVIFAVIFSILSTRIQEGGLEESLKESFGQYSAEMIAAVSDGNREHLPIALYPPVDPTPDAFGDRFNIDMTKSLDVTNFYAFRGLTARYVLPRLAASNHYPSQVRIAMLSPGDTRAISRRAADRKPWVRMAGKSLAQLQSELRQELIASVVSLFEYRRFCPVELLYVEDTAVYRYEMFDDSVFISWYHGPQSQGKELPESLRFSAGSFWYKALYLDLTRRFDISSQKVTFTHDQDDDFLMTHLSGVLGQSVTQDDIEKWRLAHEASVKDFSDYLRTVYRAIRHR